MTFQHRHKTVLVLDRSPHFLKSSQQFVDFDIFTKNRAQGFIPLAPVAKSLWTCNVEAAVEYARIVFDLFPLDKLVQLITSDQESHSLSSWNLTDQSLPQLMSAMSKHGAPDAQTQVDDCSVMHGLSQAIQALCETSEIQHKLRTERESDGSDILNRGRIICLTSLKSEKHVKMLEECVQDALTEHNKLAASTDSLLPLSHCDLVLVHIVPVGQDSNILHKDTKQVSPILSSEVHVSQSGRHVAIKMVQLVMKHFQLASTTVTGIPMKEEQNASSSANYDVELLHCMDAHTEFLLGDNSDGLVIPSKEGLYTSTVTLKWCTPKSNAMGEIQQCTSVNRITPVDVISRPSSCLTNFLLSGRAVMLEQPRKALSRTISHILASHGGEIFIHTLSTHRSILEDPPSISEGCGGRITDYRITDFGELMKLCRVAPVHDVTQLTEKPIERQKSKMDRLTRHWPMVIGETIIFNMMKNLDPMLSVVVKEYISDDEVEECQKAIYNVVSMESRNDSLPVATTGTRGKGPKRDEQYRQMWNELEKLCRAHMNNSPNHVKVLECLMRCRRPGEEITSPSKKPVVKEEKPKVGEVEEAMKELDKYQKLTEREKLEMNKPEIKIPLSPPPLKKAKMNFDLSKSGTQSLLSLWTKRTTTMNNQKRREFAGRLESKTDKAELYIQMNEENASSQTEGNNIINVKK